MGVGVRGVSFTEDCPNFTRRKGPLGWWTAFSPHQWGCAPRAAQGGRSMFSACASKVTKHQPAEEWTGPP